MRLLTLMLLLVGCDKSSADIDGDGFSIADGDCWDSLDSPVVPKGAQNYGVQPWNIHPQAEEQYYDGIDQNCDNLDDFDQDGDGFVPDTYFEIKTLKISGSGTLEGGDCHDLLEDVFPEDDLGTEGISGEDIYPGTWDRHYDGIDQNCDGYSDFDADLDGYVPERFVGVATQLAEDVMLPGGDCFDSEEDVFEDLSGEWIPVEVNPEAEEVWYDGIDTNCDGLSDYDQDGDGFEVEGQGGADCNDTDASIAPDGRDEIYYNGKDDNCDLEDGDGDKDGDSFWSRDYEYALDEVDVSVVYPASLTDCWDDDDNPPEGMDPINDFSALSAFEVKPNASERFYDGIDQNCIGDEDFDADADGFATMYYPDLDGNFGVDCVDSIEDSGYQSGSGLNPNEIKPSNDQETFYDGVDQNCDGSSDFDADLDGQDSADYGGTDCADDDPNRYFDPTGLSVPEIPIDLIDENCDGFELCYIDEDFDGYGNPSGSYALSNTIDCSESGFSLNTDDCDDGNGSRYPSAPEVCDGISNSCGGALTANEMDNDFDGYVECSIVGSGWIGDPSVIGGDDCDDAIPALLGVSVDADCDTVLTVDDCDDSDPSTINDMDCDGVLSGNDCDDFDANTINDMDCDGVLAADDCDDYDDNVLGISVDSDCDSILNEDDCDDNDPNTPNDMDCDGVLAADDCDDFDASMLDIANDMDCDGVLTADDCDDSNPYIYPNAPEICDGQVNDCNDSSGLSGDEIDNDGDGYVECDIGNNTWAGSSQITSGNDCNDANALTHPYAFESAGTVDQNCDGMEDLGYTNCESVDTGNGTRERYFIACDEALSWYNARTACLDGGYVGLAKVDYINENTAVRNLISDDSWFGLNDISSTLSYENEGIFVWGDGTSLDTNYTNWDGNGSAPIDISRNCIHINKSDGKWVDSTCYTQKPFVCSVIVESIP